MNFKSILEDTANIGIIEIAAMALISSFLANAFIWRWHINNTIPIQITMGLTFQAIAIIIYKPVIIRSKDRCLKSFSETLKVKRH